MGRSKDGSVELWSHGKTREAQPKVFSFALPVLQHSDTPLLQFFNTPVLQLSEGIAHG
jgi:hypothetical protein